MFKAPIQLLNDCNTLTKQTIDDLQLDFLYNDILGKEEEQSVREIWTNYFTTNTTYLKDTQALLKKRVFKNQEYKRVKGLFREIKDNPSFREKYEYITVEFFEAMNTNPHMLQLISMYSLTSPLISLLTPFIMLVIPFFILRVRGSTISMSTYITELKKVLSMLPIGKLFDLKNISMDQRGFVLFSVIFL